MNILIITQIYKLVLGHNRPMKQIGIFTGSGGIAPFATSLPSWFESNNSRYVSVQEYIDRQQL